MGGRRKGSRGREQVEDGSWWTHGREQEEIAGITLRVATDLRGSLQNKEMQEIICIAL